MKYGMWRSIMKLMFSSFSFVSPHIPSLHCCLLFKAGYIRIDGSVPSSERIQLVRKFQTDPDTRVAVLSIQAAGQVLQKKRKLKSFHPHPVGWIKISANKIHLQRVFKFLSGWIKATNFFL